MKKPQGKSFQHYVPRLILRNFCFNKKGNQVWVFDKKKLISFPVNITKVAGEKEFYDMSVNGQRISLESNLSKLESTVAPIIRNIIKEEDLGVLSQANAKLLSFFIAVQYCRTKYRRIEYENISTAIEEAIKSAGGDPDTVKGYTPLQENEAKEVTIEGLTTRPPLYYRSFLNKTWILLKTTKKHPFYVSDNPIAMQNNAYEGPYGNIGLEVQGIEMYFPFSKLFTLFMLCPILAEDQRKGYELHKLYGDIPNGMLKRDALMLEGMATIAQGMQTKKAIKISPSVVEILNSLQVVYSSNFVISSINDFDLAKRLIKANPELKDGPRVRLG